MTTNNASALCDRAGRKTYAYDSGGHVENGADRRYKNLTTENIVVTNKMTVGSISTPFLYGEDDLTLLACNGNITMVSSEETTIASNSTVQIISNTVVVIEAPL